MEKQCSVLPRVHSPFEKLHQQADVEKPPEDQEQTVPQADASVEGVKIQVVVITDAPDNYDQTQLLLKKTILMLVQHPAVGNSSQSV